MSLNLNSYSSGDLLNHTLSFLTPQEVISTSTVAKGWKAMVDEGLSIKEDSEDYDHPLKLQALWKTVNEERLKSIQGQKANIRNLKIQLKTIKKICESDKREQFAIGLGSVVVLSYFLYPQNPAIYNGIALVALVIAIIYSKTMKKEVDRKYDLLVKDVLEVSSKLTNAKREVKQAKGEVISIEQIKQLVKTGITSPKEIVAAASRNRA